MGASVAKLNKTLATLFCATLAGCAATTSVHFSGTPPAGSLCQAPGQSLKALVLWDTRWRPDQKEPERREAAAEQGINQFLAHYDCYADAEVRRGSAGAATPNVDRVLSINVRELGPVLKLFSSLALVDGGTEVVLDIAAREPKRAGSRDDFSIYWQNGGHGVVKGVATLPDDMEAALAAALKPAVPAR
jgi:hypothetical protein